MKHFSSALKLLGTFLLLQLTGCASGPEYQKPDPFASGAPLPDQFKEYSTVMQPAGRNQHSLLKKWWKLYNDPILDDLLDQLALANNDIAVAEAKYRQASSAQSQAQATLWPTVTGSSGISRGVTSPGKSAGTEVNLGMTVSWEIDLWGRLRRTLEARTATTLATAEDLQATHLSLQAQLVANYISLRFLDSQTQLLNSTVGAYEKSLNLTKNQYASGMVSRADVAQAEVQLQTTRAQLVDLGIQRSNLEHALAVLVGKAPADFNLPITSHHTLSLPPLPDVLPSEVLERRPDIKAAEYRVAAANAQIGIAVSAYFPNLILDSNGGFRGPGLSDLLTVPNRVWSVGPALAATLFDSGSRSAATKEAKANYDQLVSSYRQTVLTALRETEDNLATLRILQQEIEEQRLAVQASHISAALTFNQYQAGMVSYLNVAVTQAAQLNAERNMLSMQGQYHAATINFIKAIGGGWNE